MTRKILYSPGHGAGWSSWFGGPAEQRLFMLTYPGLIDAVENVSQPSAEAELLACQQIYDLVFYEKPSKQGLCLADLKRLAYLDDVPAHLLPALAEFCREWTTKWPNIGLPCTLGMHQLRVASFPDGTLVHIEEYDGSERVLTQSDDTTWF